MDVVLVKSPYNDDKDRKKEIPFFNTILSCFCSDVKKKNQ
jgi:hypothetical protein